MNWLARSLPARNRASGIMGPDGEAPLGRADEVGMIALEAEVVNGDDFAAVLDRVDGQPTAVVGEELVAGLELADLDEVAVVDVNAVLRGNADDLAQRVDAHHRRDAGEDLQDAARDDRAVRVALIAAGEVVALADFFGDRRLLRTPPLLSRTMIGVSKAKQARRTWLALAIMPTVSIAAAPYLCWLRSSTRLNPLPANSTAFRALIPTPAQAPAPQGLTHDRAMLSAVPATWPAP